VVQQRQSHELE